PAGGTSPLPRGTPRPRLRGSATAHERRGIGPPRAASAVRDREGVPGGSPRAARPRRPRPPACGSRAGRRAGPGRGGVDRGEPAGEVRDSGGHGGGPQTRSAQDDGGRGPPGGATRPDKNRPPSSGRLASGTGPRAHRRGSASPVRGLRASPPPAVMVPDVDVCSRGRGFDMGSFTSYFM